MNDSLTVSIILPTYNAAEYIENAVDSILRQTFEDFELILLDDGSTDDTRHILEKYHDNRVHIMHHSQNKGLVETLNEGLSLAKGNYIARMDADDISVPDRLASQVEFMEKNPQVDICGAYIQNFDYNGLKDIQEFPATDDDIKATLFFRNSLAHPVVMIRKSALQQSGFKYDSSYAHVEDYRLWSQFMQAGKYVFANIPKVLLYYRLDNDSVSTRHSIVQRENRERIIREHFAGFGMDESIGKLFFQVKNKLNEKEFVCVIDNLEKILKYNESRNVYAPKRFYQLLLQEKFQFARRNCHLGVTALKVFTLSEFLDSSLELGYGWRWQFIRHCLLKK